MTLLRSTQRVRWRRELQRQPAFVRIDIYHLWGVIYIDFLIASVMVSNERRIAVYTSDFAKLNNLWADQSKTADFTSSFKF